MTKPEFAQIAACLSVGVGTAFKPAAHNEPGQLEVWFDILKDLPAGCVGMAVKRYLCECEYPGLPPVGKIRRLACEALYGPLEDFSSVWEQIRLAYRAYYPGMDYERPAGVGELAWKIASSVGLRQLSDTDSPDTMRAQCRMMYEQLSANESTLKRLPEELRPRAAFPGKTAGVLESVARALALPDEPR